MHYPEIFSPYERLVEITIDGRKFQVPENNSILRCLQFLDMEGISLAELCWNGECLDCQISVQHAGVTKTVIACRATVADGMTILELSEEIRTRLNLDAN